MPSTDKHEFKSPAELLESEDGNSWLQRGLDIARNESNFETIWRKATGDIANHSQFSYIDKEQGNEESPVAVVFADSASWASQIRVSAIRLCQQLNEQLANSGSDERVTTIRVRVTPHQPDYENRS